MRIKWAEVKKKKKVLNRENNTHEILENRVKSFDVVRVESACETGTKVSQRRRQVPIHAGAGILSQGISG